MAPYLGGAPATYTTPPSPPPAPDPTFYADSVVVAYRLPKKEAATGQMQPKITSSDPEFNPAALSDGDYGTIAELNNNGATGSWIQWEFPKNFTAQSFTLGMGTPTVRGFPAIPNGRFSYSFDGVHWTDLVTLPDAPPWARPFSVRTFSFAPVSARYFRVTLEQPQLTPDQLKRGMTVPRSYPIAEMQLRSSPRVSFFEDKASFGTFIAAKDTQTPTIPAAEDAVSASDVIDLTSKMESDGPSTGSVPEAESGRFCVFDIRSLGRRTNPGYALRPPAMKSIS